jgi:hypothetical protein
MCSSSIVPTLRPRCSSGRTSLASFVASFSFFFSALESFGFFFFFAFFFFFGFFGFFAFFFFFFPSASVFSSSSPSVSPSAVRSGVVSSSFPSSSVT